MRKDAQCTTVFSRSTSLFHSGQHGYLVSQDERVSDLINTRRIYDPLRGPVNAAVTLCSYFIGV